LLLFFVFVCAGYPDNYFSDMIWKWFICSNINTYC
jgi:hypothetical protein